MSQFQSVDKMKKEGTYKEVKIKCCYCDIRDSCDRRELKEKYENAGWPTRCPFTPNVPNKKKKKATVII